jgi:trehalose 6-phosphate synthase
MALSMRPAEQRERMRLMRRLIEDFNVYRWAGRMLLDAARMRRRDRLVERTSLTARLPRFASGVARASAL